MLSRRVTNLDRLCRSGDLFEDCQARLACLTALYPQRQTKDAGEPDQGGDGENARGQIDHVIILPHQSTYTLFNQKPAECEVPHTQPIFMPPSRLPSGDAARLALCIREQGLTPPDAAGPGGRAGRQSAGGGCQAEQPAPADVPFLPPSFHSADCEREKIRAQEKGRREQEFSIREQER